VPLAFNCEGNALISLVLQDILDVRVAHLEGECHICAFSLGKAIVELSVGKFGAGGAETALCLVDHKMMLIQRIYQIEVKLL